MLPATAGWSVGGERSRRWRRPTQERRWCWGGGDRSEPRAARSRVGPLATEHRLLRAVPHVPAPLPPFVVGVVSGAAWTPASDAPRLRRRSEPRPAGRTAAPCSSPPTRSASPPRSWPLRSGVVGVAKGTSEARRFDHPAFGRCPARRGWLPAHHRHLRPPHSSLAPSSPGVGGSMTVHTRSWPLVTISTMRCTPGDVIPAGSTHARPSAGRTRKQAENR